AAICEIPRPEATEPQPLTEESRPTVGLFELEIRTISGTPAGGYSGSGIIVIPFLNEVKVLVQFERIKVNTDNQVFEGEVEAQKDRAWEIPLLNNGLAGNVLNMAGVDKNEINAAIQEPARWLSLYEDGEMALPLTLDNGLAMLGLMDMTFTPEKASLKVVCNMDFPTEYEITSQLISLGAVICFGPEGLEDDRLIYQVDDINLTGNEGGYDLYIKGINQAQTLDTTRVSYLEWDCDGFRKFNLAGELVFPRDDMVPVNEQGQTIDGDEQVKAFFRVSWASGDGWIAGLDFNHAFTPTGLDEGWVFAVDNAYIDQSTLENPPNLVFPEYYEDEDMFNPEFDQLWRGAFIEQVTVRVPERFKTFNQTGQLTFQANNLLYDGTGFTADVRAEHLIAYPSGDLDGWQYSLDTIALRWVSSTFRKGRLAGNVRIAGLEEDEFIHYYALLNRVDVEDPNTQTTNTESYFEMIAQPNAEIDYRFDALRSTLKIAQDSRLEATHTPADGWEVLATLNGALTLDGNLSSAIQQIPYVNFTGITFQGFQIGNKVGFEPGIWAVASPQKTLAGFPVTLDGLTVARELSLDGVRLGLSFDLTVNVAEYLSGSSSLVLWAELHMPGDSVHFASFGGASMEDIDLDHDFGIVKLDGGITYYEDDPVFGNGFKGEIDAEVRVG
ncbi:MAG: hypothetical protein KDC54_16400, partial [Lewinella sp.]|nr:hypothetical protein [Lewinella sp.]